MVPLCRHGHSSNVTRDPTGWINVSQGAVRSPPAKAYEDPQTFLLRDCHIKSTCTPFVQGAALSYSTSTWHKSDKR